MTSIEYFIITNLLKQIIVMCYKYENKSSKYVICDNKYMEYSSYNDIFAITPHFDAQLHSYAHLTKATTNIKTTFDSSKSLQVNYFNLLYILSTQ